jgi:hypothetical protein
VVLPWASAVDDDEGLMTLELVLPSFLSFSSRADLWLYFLGVVSALGCGKSLLYPVRRSFVWLVSMTLTPCRRPFGRVING